MKEPTDSERMSVVSYRFQKVFLALVEREILKLQPDETQLLAVWRALIHMSALGTLISSKGLNLATPILQAYRQMTAIAKTGITHEEIKGFMVPSDTTVMEEIINQDFTAFMARLPKDKL